MPTTYVPKRLNPNREARFHLCDNLTFICSVELRDFLTQTAKDCAPPPTDADGKPIPDAKPKRMSLSRLCRDGLVQFLNANKPDQTRHIGPRLTKHKPLPQHATVPMYIPRHKDPNTRRKLFEYSRDNDLTISTVLRRAAYTYALKLQRAVNPDYEEDPLLILDAWLNIDNRGQTKQVKPEQNPDHPMPVTKEEFVAMKDKWLKEATKPREEFEPLEKLTEGVNFKLPAKPSKDPDAWIVDGEMLV